MNDTRIWWDGNEVVFVRWTERSLVFAWCDTAETAVQLPRGAVVRLLEKGVLHIEGITPAWILREQPVYQPIQSPVLPVQPAVQTIPEVKNESSSKLSAIARLIRKLGGGEPKSAPRTAG